MEQTPEDVTWSLNTFHRVKKAQQHLFFSEDPEAQQIYQETADKLPLLQCWGYPEVLLVLFLHRRRLEGPAALTRGLSESSAPRYQTWETSTQVVSHVFNIIRDPLFATLPSGRLRTTQTNMDRLLNP